MDKKLQNLAWSVLPKEFKEELQFQYKNGSLEKREEMRDLYGSDNLISDITASALSTKSDVQSTNFCQIEGSGFVNELNKRGYA